jgi:hypothetical protein
MGRPVIYLDASVILPLFLRQSRSADAERLIVAGGHALSDLSCAEFSSAISIAVRTGRLPVGAAREKLAMFDAWVGAEAHLNELSRDDFAAATLLVRRFELALRTPDALHIAIAMRLGATLATFDERMAGAARAVGLSVKG